MQKRFALGAAGALVLFATGSWAQEARFTISGYQVEGSTLLPQAEVQQILSGYTGPGRSLDDINAATDALRQAYEKAGYPVVRIYPPEQSATGGNIVLKVIEGKVETITVKGNQAYSEANIRASLPSVRAGEPPRAPRIVAEIAMANENPAKQVAVNFQAGEQPGSIDATINVVEDRPQKFTASLDNGGSKSTGVNRFTLGYQNANLFNRDHMVTAQIGTSPDYPSKSLNISAGYRVPFYGHGLSLDLIAAYSDTDSGTTLVPGGTMAFTGKGTIFGARLNHPMASIGEYRHKLVYGYDYKDFDNRCKQGAVNIPAAQCGTITSQPLSVTYVAQHATPGLQLGGSAMFAVNVPGGAHGEANDYNTAVTHQRANWNLWRFTAFAAVPLAADWQFRANAAAQTTEHKLISGEQFGVGGASSVRGYTERAIAGDEGISGNLELYTPELAGLLSLPAGAGLRGLVFYDAGRIYHNSPAAGQRQQSISSAGLGLRFNWQRDLSAKLDVGIAQDRLRSQTAGVGRDRGDAYGQFAINYSF